MEINTDHPTENNNAVDLELAIKEAATITYLLFGRASRTGKGRTSMINVLSKGIRCALLGSCWPGDAGSG